MLGRVKEQVPTRMETIAITISHKASDGIQTVGAPGAGMGVAGQGSTKPG